MADASAVFIILGDLEANKSVEAVFLPLVDAGLMPDTAYETILGDVNRLYETQKAKTRDEAFLNASLFAMQLMLAAKSIGYDTGPMEHLEKRQYDKMITHYLNVSLANYAGIPNSKVEFLYETLDTNPGHMEKLLTQAYSLGLNYAKD